MKSFVVSFFIVLGSMAVPTQGFAQAGTQQLNLQTLPANTNCPVELTAKRGIGFGGTLAIEDGQWGRAGQELEVRLTNRKPDELSRIRITVHGFYGKGGLVLTESTARAHSSDSDKAAPLGAKKTFNIQLNLGVNKMSSTNLWMNDFIAISLIDVDLITYANGSVWHSSTQAVCHFAPEGTTLISIIE